MNVAAVISLMRARGFSDSDIVDVIQAGVDGACARSAAAERQARYRDRKAANVTSDVTSDVTASHDTPPPNSPPLSSPAPPTNTPPLSPHPRIVSARASDGETMLLAAGMTAETLGDWKRVRTAKRAGPITQRVAEGFIRECRKADMSPEEAGRKCCEKGWQGFEADWVNKPQQRAGPMRPPQPLRGSAAIADALHRITTDAPDNPSVPRGVAGFLPSR